MSKIAGGVSHPSRGGVEGPLATNDFTVAETNRVRRGHEHADDSRETAFGILDSGHLCDLSFILYGTPGALPKLYWLSGEHIYWHGSSASRAIREMAKGGSVCLNVSHLDGLLLGRSAFHHSANYRSVTIHGAAEPVAVRILRLPIETMAAKSRYDISIGGLLDRNERITQSDFAEGTDNPA
ncbi:pyridoxamine 5'-phosphate oxidase family protein [Ruegeria sp. A3M17]|uniref:pyridoxamine 5'-phosphate oxidase family protein n=1 Tax=Ruegeria sp. A3M17 TaxID=2267229 RepID=UPI000DE9903F|nr:pyridoxamine 5'-phosphate oxidase family protein [Ruegeria sp. A3M17]RBW52568.1 hypothetical protein DS906_20660 [Ruegeria sp. A3M17]